MREVLDKPLIDYLLERLHRSKRIEKTIVAIPMGGQDDRLNSHLQSLGQEVFRGSEEDVLDRYYQAACEHRSEIIVRITADCPLIDPEVVDKTIDYFERGRFDYVSNGLKPPLYPNGLETEVFWMSSLETVWREAGLASEREHVTPYLYKHPEKFRLGYFHPETDYAHERWTVDHEEDFELIKTIIENLYPKTSKFGMAEILKFKDENPKVFKINQQFRRGEGYQKSLREDRIAGGGRCGG